MQRRNGSGRRTPHVRRLLAALCGLAAPAMASDTSATASTTATTLSAEAEATRPAFRMPFVCGQTWRGSNWYDYLTRYQTSP